MDAIEDLLSWATACGLEQRGIRPQSLPGRGIGIVATRDLKVDEVVLEVPVKLLKGIHSVPRSTARRLPRDQTVHGLLAADVCLDRSSTFAKWRAVFPSKEDVFASMPLAWNPRLSDFLPLPARKLLVKQQAKFGKDWDAVSKAFPGAILMENYLYAWLLVNSRTFYYVTPRTERFARDDRMVLQPVADLFNHADQGCAVSFDSVSFTIRTDRAYAQGEELFISYGNHSNDFLLVEYGFCLAQNRWDEACIDDAILPNLKPDVVVRLRELDFLGNYTIDAQAVCFRTQVALRATAATRRHELLNFVQGDEGDWTEDRTSRALAPLLEKYASKIQDTLRQIEDGQPSEPSQRQVLRQRWLQVLELVRLHQKQN